MPQLDGPSMTGGKEQAMGDSRGLRERVRKALRSAVETFRPEGSVFQTRPVLSDDVYNDAADAAIEVCGQHYGIDIPDGKVLLWGRVKAHKCAECGHHEIVLGLADSNFPLRPGQMCAILWNRPIPKPTEPQEDGE